LLTNKGKYGIKALHFLAKLPPGESARINEIAESKNIPKKFLEVILLDLKRKGYVQSKSGKGGGYWLIREPKDIMMGDVVRLLDGPLAPVRCASYTAYIPCPDCSDVDNCEVRLLMKDVRDAISGVLDNRSLQDMHVVCTGSFIGHRCHSGINNCVPLRLFCASACCTSTSKHPSSTWH
jgi:Rrf2 family protein